MPVKKKPRSFGKGFAEDGSDMPPLKGPNIMDDRKFVIPGPTPPPIPGFPQDQKRLKEVRSKFGKGEMPGTKDKMPGPSRMQHLKQPKEREASLQRRSTTGSAPFTQAELSKGYRKL